MVGASLNLDTRHDERVGFRNGNGQELTLFRFLNYPNGKCFKGGKSKLVFDSRPCGDHVLIKTVRDGGSLHNLQQFGRL